MTKSIIITMTDGTTVVRDLQNAIEQGMKAANLPITMFANANSRFFVDVMNDIAANGLWHYEGSSQKYSRFIPPSQIMNVEVVFSEPKMTV